MNIIIDFTDYKTIILLVFGICIIIQLFYYLFFYLRLAIHKETTDISTQEPVSIIICARNEGVNLTKFLPNILNQNYKKFEVIVVNDCSTDDSKQILENFKKQYPQLKVTTIIEEEKFTHGKKLALTIGIKAAMYEWILLTDADCQVSGNQWLESMQRNFTDKNDIVLGYSGYHIRKPLLLNNIIRFDTFFIGLQYLSFALAGFPYMGVGRNLAYRKSLFFKNKGFASHFKLLSGDDDLFINQTANASNLKIETSHNSLVLSEPKTSLSDWFRQKKRHLSTGKYYKFSSKFLISLEVFSRLLFYSSFLFLLISQSYYTIIFYPFALRLIIQAYIFYKSLHKLNEKYLFLPSLVYDIILPIFNIGIYLATIVSPKRHKW